MQSDNGYCSDSKRGFECHFNCNDIKDTANFCFCTDSPRDTKYVTENMFNLSNNISQSNDSTINFIKNSLKSCFQHDHKNKIKKITCDFINGDNNLDKPMSSCSVLKNEAATSGELFYVPKNEIINSEELSKSNFFSSFFYNFQDSEIIPLIIVGLFVLFFLFFLVGYFIHKRRIRNLENRLEQEFNERIGLLNNDAFNDEDEVEFDVSERNNRLV